MLKGDLFAIQVQSSSSLSLYLLALPRLSDRKPVTMTETLDSEAQKAPPAAWAPSKHERAIMLLLAVISLMVALDSCIVVTALPVG
jgi:hypothetical protein